MTTLTPERLAELDALHAECDEPCYQPNYAIPVRRLILLGLLAERDTLAARLREAVELLRDMAYDDPCSFDHHGHCQAHLWFGDGRCPHARAAAFLARTEPAK